MPNFTTDVTFIVNGQTQTLEFTAQARSEYSADQLAAHSVKALHPGCTITNVQSRRIDD